ncbi:hypothetical protein EVAR_23677_1 [Eumeta japonica]|uniref:Uncharacterized protein n=1 Tax=Eumeta variegata TaxID=151549 RepID=A0A4C1VIX3_EUMVA|nr:hypothetical protein EVAR_23677_1 [Eumeta japonica]
MAGPRLQPCVPNRCGTLRLVMFRVSFISIVSPFWGGFDKTKDILGGPAARRAYLANTGDPPPPPPPPRAARFEYARAARAARRSYFKRQRRCLTQILGPISGQIPEPRVRRFCEEPARYSGDSVFLTPFGGRRRRLAVDNLVFFVFVSVHIEILMLFIYITAR